jgi:hypothetical protein
MVYTNVSCVELDQLSFTKSNSKRMLKILPKN